MMRAARFWSFCKLAICVSPIVSQTVQQYVK